MIKSDSIKEIAKALNEFQSEQVAAKKSSKNPFFKSNYADLKSVWDSCHEVLNRCGLSISQLPISNENGVGVTTILMHTSGEYIGSECTLPLSKKDPQQAGSAITYARRYGLSAILSLMTEEDDDGNKATHEPLTKTKIQPKKAPPVTDNVLLLIKNAREKAQIHKDIFATFINNQIAEKGESVQDACKRDSKNILEIIKDNPDRIMADLPF